MTANVKRAPFEEYAYVKGSWVPVNSTSSIQGLPHNQQLSSLAYREARLGPPPSIVIEKLVRRPSTKTDGDSCNSSLRFSVLSEERLQDAVRLAKRDLRKRRQQSLINSPLTSSPCAPERGLDDELAKGHQLQRPVKTSPDGQQNVNISKSMTRSGAEVLVYTPAKLSAPLVGPAFGQSPPCKDPGPKVDSKLSQEIRKLQRELGTYVQRTEQLVAKDRLMEEHLEPDERRRMEIRRQEQTARSARIIYNLQQQVKGIQEEVEKLQTQNLKHTKKSRAMDRLAAAHRGAVRAMQVFSSQLSDATMSRVPPHYKELGQLIRQLSLCSAKMEAGQHSAVPQTAIDILHKLEVGC